MRRGLTNAAAPTIALILLAMVFLVRPINETAPIKQQRGTEITKAYLGRTISAAKGKGLRQTFAIAKPGRMQAVGIFFPILNRASTGQVRFRLTRVNGADRAPNTGKDGQVIIEQTTPISRLANNEGLTIWRFAPVRVAKGQIYSIELFSEADPEVFVFMSTNSGYNGGSLWVEGRKTHMDMTFQVFYGLDARSLWAHLSGAAPNLVGPAFLVVALFGLWATLAFYLRGLAAVKL